MPSSPIRHGALTLAAALLLLAAPPAFALPAGSTILVDRPTGLGPLPFDGVGDSSVVGQSLSANGCFAVFTSRSDILSPSDQNSATNVYRRDRCSPGAPLVQVNTTAGGAPAEADSDSEDATISADGRFVAFVSDAGSFDPAATSRSPQVFVKDVDTGAIELASRGNGAGAASEEAFDAVISGDGEHVAFVAAGALDAGDVGGVEGVEDLYVRSLLTDTTRMVSRTSGGSQGGGAAGRPAISHTGSTVAFVTSSGLVAGDDDGDTDAYVRQNIGGAESTRLVSTGAAASPERADDVALSGPGTAIAFAAAGGIWRAACAPGCLAPERIDDALPGGANTFRNVAPFFARRLGGAAPARVYWHSFSPLDPADGDDEGDVYARDTVAPTQPIFLLTGGSADGEVVGADATDDGAVVVFDSVGSSLPGDDADRQVFSRGGGEDVNISQPAGVPPQDSAAGIGRLSRLHATSDDGRVVAFTTEALALGATASPDGPRPMVMARDVVAGTTTAVSVSFDGTAPDGPSTQPSVDAAGRMVAFTSDATNLVPGVTATGAPHVFVRDIASGTTTLVDRADQGGGPAAGGALDPQISGDGATVVFTSASPDLPEAPQAGEAHVYAADVTTGSIRLVDRAPDGAPANLGALTPDVSHDGNRVAFVSASTNLGAGATAGRNVYVRELAAGRTLWASVAADADPLHSEGEEPSLSRSGRRVAFVSGRADFGHGATGEDQVFVRDLDAGTTTLASTGPFGAADRRASDQSLSADGTRVAFSSSATNLGRAGTGTSVYVRDLVAGTTGQAALRDRGTIDGNRSETTPSISGSGACVAFESSSDDLVTPSYGPDDDHVFLRVLSADCQPASGPGGGPDKGPVPEGRDTTAPVIGRARLSNTSFALAKRKTARIAAKAKRGTAFRFTLSENARTTIAIARQAPGRRKGRRCVKPRAGLKRKCTRLVPAVTLTRARTRAGSNTVAYTGRVGSKRLRPGRYRATLRAIDPAGNRSKPKLLSFKVVRR